MKYVYDEDGELFEIFRDYKFVYLHPIKHELVEVLFKDIADFEGYYCLDEHLRNEGIEVLTHQPGCLTVRLENGVVCDLLFDYEVEQETKCDYRFSFRHPTSDEIIEVILNDKTEYESHNDFKNYLRGHGMKILEERYETASLERIESVQNGKTVVTVRVLDAAYLVQTKTDQWHELLFECECTFVLKNDM